MPKLGTLLSVATRDRIDDLLDRDDPPSGPAIYHEIKRAIAAKELDGLEPGMRSVQRYIGQRGDRARSPWLIETDTTGAPRLILDTIRTLAERSSGRVIMVTQDEAAQIARMAVAIPSLDVVARWRLAKILVARRARGAPTDDLTLLLALEPWTQGKEGWNRYFNLAIVSGMAPNVMLMAHLNSDVDPIAEGC